MVIKVSSWLNTQCCVHSQVDMAIRKRPPDSWSSPVVMNPSSPCEGQSPEGDPPDDWFHLSTMSLGTQGSDGSRDDPEEPEERGRLKSKLVSAWNNVKYGMCA